MDATGCFDRILPNLMPPHVRRLGIPKSAAVCLAKLLYGFKRFIRAKFGISEDYIRTAEHNVLYGIGQGNGGGPVIWLTHLTILFAVMDKLVKGMQFRSPEGKVKYYGHETGCMDDCTLGVTAELNEEKASEQAVEKMIRNG